MFVSCYCRVLSVRGLCDELITRPEESYRVWCVSECDCEASVMGRPWPIRGCCAIGGKILRRTSHTYSHLIEQTHRIISCGT